MTRRVLLLLLLAGCGASEGWKAPPAGRPGSEARSGDQSEPRLEPLAASPAATPAARPVDELAQAAALSSEASALRAAGNLPTAIARQRGALALRERALGAQHPDVATTLTSLAALHAARDDYGAAEPLLRRALAIREAALGPDDVQTAQSLNNLALLLAAAGHFADAEPLYQRAIAVFETTEANALATALDNYAALLDDSGRADEAAAATRRADAVRAALGKPLQAPDTP